MSGPEGPIASGARAYVLILSIAGARTTRGYYYVVVTPRYLRVWAHTLVLLLGVPTPRPPVTTKDY